MSDQTIFGRLRGGWSIIACAFLMALYSWGLGFYGQAVFLEAVQASRSWSTSVVSAGLTFYYLAGAVFLTFVPGAFDRFGARAVTSSGAVLLAVGAASLSVVTAPWQLFLAGCVMALGWATTSGTAVVLLIAPWFVHNRGLAVSLALNGASAAGFVIAPPLIGAIHAFGFDAAVAWAALLMLVAILPVIALGARRPGANWTESATPSKDSGHSPDWRAGATVSKVHLPSRNLALRSPVFWTLAAPYAIGMAAQVGFLMHQVAILTPVLGPGGAARLVAATTAAALAGRVMFGFLADRLDSRRVASLAFANQVVALGAILAGLFTSIGQWPIYLGCIAFGLSVGIAITLPALIATRDFTAASFGQVAGLTAAFAQFAFAFGPLVLGLLFDHSGNYGMAIGACIVLEVLAAVLILGRDRCRVL